MSEALQQAIIALRQQGLNLFSILEVDQLPGMVQQTLGSFVAGVSAEKLRVILIGHAGRVMWDALPDRVWRQSNPIDYFSTQAAEQFCNQVLGEVPYQIIYPGEQPVSLQQLGTAAGWHTDSPLGLGINAEWGLWYAYRAAILTSAHLPSIKSQPPQAPCSQCASLDCIVTCPANALGTDSPIDMPRCAEYRLQDDSLCRDRCVARMNCPVSKEHRYTLSQIQYHYRLSLETLRHYYGKPPNKLKS